MTARSWPRDPVADAMRGEMNSRQSRGTSGARGAGRTTVCACVLVAAMLVAAPSAWANKQTGAATEGGLGIAAAVSSLVYGPTKIVYAVGGTVIAGFAWVFSGGDTKVATIVLTRSVRGTYVITPRTLLGKEEIEFVGRSPEYRSREGDSQVAAAPDAW